jgi:hypothetical protein
VLNLITVSLAFPFGRVWPAVLYFLPKGRVSKEELATRDQTVFERHKHCCAGDPDGLGKFHIIGRHRLVFGTELRAHFDAIDEVDEWIDS